jgi:hypothetical protein
MKRLFVKRQELEIKDFLPGDPKYGVNSYGNFEMSWWQDTNELCRFPELIPIFDAGFTIESAESWNYFRFQPYDDPRLKEPETERFVLQCLHDAFSCCKKIAIVFDRGYIEVTSEPKYMDESFKVYRNRHLFKIRDILGIGHGGRGSDSIRLESKHTG